ncbi:hypothetical protein [Streptomyces boluensis]|uniref:Uncharacterized protein n=1 Tax=Streptomyces boluensis TaxID=1775135 RepID=A0A964UM26_9ACTN|nr:hypothetical protein [Streptomyces boluensis]NBE51147.1 hypothetical protein [Streptomyces boluensis]
MSETHTVHVRVGEREVRWTLRVRHGDGQWHLTLRSPHGVECEASGNDVFHALRTMRAELAPRGVTLCCNGARVDVRPSGLSRSHGAWMVYVLPRWRPTTARDLVPTLGYAPADRIGSVEEQDAYWARHLRHRRNPLNFINPVWWIYWATASWGRPRK